jgi:hypothetical protein
MNSDYGLLKRDAVHLVDNDQCYKYIRFSILTRNTVGHARTNVFGSRTSFIIAFVYLSIHPASCTMGTGFFPRVKRPDRVADHPPPSSAEIMNEESYNFNPPLGLRGLYRVPLHF